MPTPDGFDRKGWISRFGEALEETVVAGTPLRVPLSTFASKGHHRHYREMAGLARTDSYAAKLFDESYLWFDELSDGVLELLLEHPVIEHAWSGGSREALHYVQILGSGHLDAESLIARLAKLSVKVGGKRAATMLHRFLVAGEGVRLHGDEITVLHGLSLDEPIRLGHGTFLASYDAVRKGFGLPEDPEPWLRRSDEGLDLHPGRLAHVSSRAVFVRRLRWGPAVARCNCPTNREEPLRLRYWFPEDHCVESVVGMFEEREALLHLLSIAVRSKLVSHTVIDAVPVWMSELNPNLRTGPPGGGRGVFDVWPEDLTPSMQDLEAFTAAARGWLTFCAGKGDRSMELAVRRTAASFGIPGGRFGAEDRLIDAGIALEAMYGPFGRRGITRKIRCRAARLLGESAAERRAVCEQMKSFYDTRSEVVHGAVGKDRLKRERELAGALSSGRELARRTLFRLLARGPINDEPQWDALVSEGPSAASVL